MKILLVSPESGNWNSVTSLGEAVDLMAHAYTQLGHEVRVISPYYRQHLSKNASFECVFMAADILKGRQYSILHEQQSNHYHVDYPEYFDREFVYNSGGEPYADNHLRFSLLGLAALQFCMEDLWVPDRIHSHEWGSGLCCSYAKTIYGDFFGKIPLQLTIHNLKYDHYVFESEIEAIGLDRRDFRIDGYEFWGKVSQLKVGIYYADQVVLTSKGYWNRMKDQVLLAGGIQGFLQVNKHKIIGIQSGLDYQRWSFHSLSVPIHPAKDFKCNLKKDFKGQLLRQIGLDTVNSNTPLLYCHIDAESGRLAQTLSTIMSNLLRMDVFVVIGIPEDHKEYSYFKMVQSQSTNLAVFPLGGALELLPRLAAADMLFAVALSEPSANLLLKAMSMGTVPVTSRNNGCEEYLAGYSVPFDDDCRAFISESEEPDRMLRSLRQALQVYEEHPDEWHIIAENVCEFRRTWEQTVKEYLQQI
jgi:starch synthase